jgi:hypothetical protein
MREIKAVKGMLWWHVSRSGVMYGGAYFLKRAVKKYDANS